jgi:predicted NUDIX family phosphoesterase
MKKQVLVIEKEKLFSFIGGHFQGFSALPAEIFDFLETYCCWMDKDAAEKDPHFKQIIGYAAILSPSEKIFTYQRSSEDKHYNEKRLQGKWSIGIGGHVDKGTDIGANRILTSITREINEEIDNDGIKELRLLGGINDDADSVGQVHFGILLMAKISSEKAVSKDPEIASGELRSFAETTKLFKHADVENWSRYLLPIILSELKIHIRNFA